MRTSKRDNYFVAEWPAPDEAENHYLGAIIEGFPEIVKDRFVVISSWDSGQYIPDEEELKAGWSTVNKLAYSPQITDPSLLNFETYDEWYVFEKLTRVEEIEPMVNFIGFSPIDFGWKEKLNLFWSQVQRLQPLHVIADGSHLFLITRDEELYNRIINT